MPGFLGNLREMYETADAEGAIWRVFIAQWWDRFGTADVGTADLYQLALACEPPLPLGEAGERSQRTRLGKALGRMRDRVFDIGIKQVRLVQCGEQQRAQRWRLALVESDGERCERSSAGPPPHVNVGERFPGADDENGGERCGQRSPQRSLQIRQQNQPIGERGERCERFSVPYARADARARAIGDAGKCSPCSQRSLPSAIAMTCEGERGSERSDQRSSAPSAAAEPAGTCLDYDAIFDAYGLSPLSEHDRIEAARILMSQATGPPDAKPDLRRADGGGVPGSSPPPSSPRRP